VLPPVCDLSRGLLETSERDAEVVVPSYLVSTKWVQRSLTPQEKAQAWDFPVGQGVAASGGLDKEGVLVIYGPDLINKWKGGFEWRAPTGVK
jgi:hypothetical protein